MLPRSAILAITLTLAWCWGAWHENLEAAGCMWDHKHHHHHGAEQPGSHEHSPLNCDDHEPLWARSLANEARGVLLLQVLFSALALVAVWMLAVNLRLVGVRPREAPNRRARDFDPVWHFVRRCAPDAAAPPAMG